MHGLYYARKFTVDISQHGKCGHVPFGHAMAMVVNGAQLILRVMYMCESGFDYDTFWFQGVSGAQ